MNLSTLNNPVLISSLGAGILYALPIVERLATNGDISWVTLKAVTVVSYLINVAAVSQPGRLDGEASKGGSMSPKLERTLVAPAPWAFAIWGPIFTGEAVFVVSQLFLAESASIVPLLKKVYGPFIVTQLFQALWCASFRTKYEGNLLFISSAMLASGAYSLSKAHAAFTSDPKSYSNVQYAMYFLPIALHFGWLTAASLVNINASVSSNEKNSPKVVALVGHASVILAAALGAFVTVSRSAPVVGGVVSWALLAVASSMKMRIDKSSKGKEVPGLHGAGVQRTLATLGAVVCGGSSLFVATSSYFHGNDLINKIS